ncbi:MAG: hypothetical protein A2289_13665 [Deltaproteobacteria bacterium RIFOXYA12_FULL_58_15]|nr:MAG: hypothetical protein A2289_13665 [Deltaproteobacteria bacterium RIFOXYA12_FULL_58_15]OGR09658.1 MAG: hypothetical protein A2341_14785 [Deltaproteobacteria bacterium RIFOXYB12_FULL_58_9]
MFHPVTQSVARALGARAHPPPPKVPPLSKKQMNDFAKLIATHPSRAEIARGLLALAVRLHTLDFKLARNQLLLLCGFGLSEEELRDHIESMGTEESQARLLMEKTKSSQTNPLADALRQKAALGVSGARLRGRPGKKTQ